MVGDELRELHAMGRSLIPVAADKRPFFPWKAYQFERPDLAQLERWDEEYSPPIWAGVTGEVSGFISLDFDMPAGPATAATLGLTPHRSTPSGGLHVDVAHPGWKVSTVSGTAKKSLAAQYPGLDVRGDGGYINMIGHTNTGKYKWLTSERTVLPLTTLPDDLRTTLGLDAPPTSPAENRVAATMHIPSSGGVPVDLCRPDQSRVAAGARGRPK